MDSQFPYNVPIILEGFFIQGYIIVSILQLCQILNQQQKVLLNSNLKKRNQDNQAVYYHPQSPMNNASCYFSSQLTNLYPISDDSSTSGCSYNLSEKDYVSSKYRHFQSNPQQIHKFQFAKKFSFNQCISFKNCQKKNSNKTNQQKYLQKQKQSKNLLSKHLSQNLQKNMQTNNKSKSKEKILSNSLKKLTKNKSISNKKLLNVDLNKFKVNQYSKHYSNSSNKISLKKQKKINTIAFKNSQKIRRPQIKQSTNISKDYLILGQNIFECEDMDVHQIVQQILAKGSSPKFYSYERYFKSVSGNTCKIEKYLKGFLAIQRFDLRNESRKTSLLQTYGFKNLESDQQFVDFDIDLDKMTSQQKQILYQMLVKQDFSEKQYPSSMQSHQKVSNQPDEDSKDSQKCQSSRIQIDQILGNTLSNLQERYQKLRNQTVESQTKMRLEKWKNQKMHQLLSAKQLLAQSLSENARNFDEYFSLETQQVFENELQQLVRKASQIHTFKQIKGQTRILCRQLRKHLQFQKYPSKSSNEQKHFQTQQIRIAVQNSLQPNKRDRPNSYFGDTGFFQFLNSFRQFIKHNEDYMDQFLTAMQKPFGYSSVLKYQLMRIHQNDWWDLLQQQQSIVQSGPISHNTYSDFAQKIIGNGQTMQLRQQKYYIHVFNNALLQALNNRLNTYRIFYPNGVCIPYVQPHKLTEYCITQDNFDDIWDRCIGYIYQSVKLLAGVIYQSKIQYRISQSQNQFLQFRNSQQSQPQQEIPANVRYHRTQKLKDFLALQIKQQQEQYNSMMYLALGQVNFEIQNAIEAILYQQTAILLKQICQKRQIILF